MSNSQLGPLLHSFFEDQLTLQKGLRPTSIKSYRDAMRMFLLFTAKDAQRKLTRLDLKDLTGERVRKFLGYLESERHNLPSSRNQRLAAVRAFFEYLAEREPLMLAEAQRVEAIPVKRAQPPETRYLERDEIKALFEKLPSAGSLALRNHALLLFLYNTGARVQEVADLCASNLELDEKPRVRLHGKGDKWRVCPLWDRTAAMLRRLLEQRSQPTPTDRPIFISRNGTPLTRFGIHKIVRHHTTHIGKMGSDGKPRTISPHVFRHTAAVHLLEAGVEVNVIRAWLGHVSLETTNRYAEISIRMKAEALKACELTLDNSEESLGKPIWKDDPELLKWLQSL